MTPSSRGNASSGLRRTTAGAAKKRGRPSAWTTTIPTTELGGIIDVPRPVEVDGGDDRLQDQDDRHLDDDRPFDPEDGTRVGYDPTVEPLGNLGRRVLAFDVDASGTPSFRTTDYSASSATDHTRTLRLRRVAELILGTCPALITAPDRQAALMNASRLTYMELVRDETMNPPGPGHVDRDFMERIGYDSVQFPWGECTFREIWLGVKQGHFGAADVSVADIASGWRSVVSVRAVAAKRGGITRIKDHLSGVSTAWGQLSDAQRRKYATDFCWMLEHADTIWLIAEQEVSADSVARFADLRRRNGMCIKSLAELIHNGILEHPAHIHQGG